MAQQVKLRRSSVAGNKPTTAQLELGELAINTNDGKLYFEKSSSLGESVQEIIVTDAWNTGSINVSGSVTVSGSINATSFTGSLFGTASYASNALSSSYALVSTSASYAATSTSASYASQATTASYANNATSASYSLTSISASYALSASYAATSSYAKNIVISGSINNVDYIDFNTGSATPAWKSGRVFWDNTDGALAVYNAEQDITLQVGQENWVRVFNASGVLITDGTPVKLVGSHGDVPEIQLAQSVRISGSIEKNNQILGLATHDIEINTIGYVTVEGIVRGLNTNVFNDGDRLFVSSSAGKLTNIPPPAPYEVIPVGVVVKAGPGGSGIIYVSTQQPIDFSDLSSVLVSGSYHYGDLWVYRPSGSTGVWEHTNQLSGSYSVTGSWRATSFTGSLLGTSSYATQALNATTASYVATASYVPTLQQVTTQGNTTTNAITSSGLYVSGSATISGNLNVFGTASFAVVTSSVVIVGDSTIVLSTDLPAVRFGGIEVVDSGSFGNSSTGSLLWDSLNNRWIYSNPSGSTYDGGLLMSGPRNTSGLGNEVGTTLNAILKGQGGDHLTSSALIENGTSVNFYNNAAIITSAGSVTATSFTGSLLGSLQGTASYATQALSASYALTSTSASYALNATSAETASYANNFTVAGTLTAQTLIAQTITSSFIYSSGSNVFGSSLSNTQVFTGSLYQTGSVAVFLSNVAIGTTSPSYTLDVNGTGRFGSALTINGTSVASTVLTLQESITLPAALAIRNRNSNQTWGLAVDTATVDDKNFGIYNITNPSFPLIINATTSAATFSAGVTATSFTGSLLGTASYAANALSASYALNTTSASYALNTTSASYADTASYAPLYLPLTLSADTTASIGANKLFFKGTTAQMLNAERITTTGTGGRTALTLAAKTTDNNIQDGYGPLLGFEIKDDAGVISTMAAIVGTRKNNNTSGQLDFYTWNNGSFAQHMVLTSTGSLGIGTASPTLGKLEVNGNVYATSFTGSLLGTASYASNALSSSYALTATSASYAEVAVSASYFSGSISTAISASYAATASYAVLATTASYFSGSLSAPGSTTQILYNNGGTIAGDSGLVYSGSNVGIGTTSPGVKLEVNAGANAGSTDLLRLSRNPGYGSTTFTQTYDSTYFAFGKTLTLKNDSGTSFAHFAGNNAGTTTNLLIPTGSIGIGTTSPVTKLQVVGGYISTKDDAAYGGAFLEGGSGVSYFGSLGSDDIQLYTGGATKVTIKQSSGNVGIGTTSPATKLQVNGTFASNALWTDVTSVAYWGSYPTVYGGLTWDTGYAMVFATTGNALRFATNGSGASMTITTSGNVGIGTTNPSQKLTVGDGNGTGNQYIRVYASASDIYIGQSGGTILGLSANSAGLIISDNTSFPFAIGTIAAQSLIFGTTNTERMRIAAGGNVGIGTTNPAAKLDIKGDLIISSSLIINQNTSSLASGAQTVSTNATSSYTAAFYNYTVASGSNARAGQVTAVWNGGSIQYTDVSTTDIGSTLGVAFTASLSGANVQLTTIIPTSGWTVKTLANLI
jgi:hypothetical protein